MFEKVTKIDNSREADGPRENNYTIELSDKEHRERLEAAKIARQPPPIIVEKITKDTKTVKIKREKKNAKSKSKSPSKKPKTTNPISDKSAVEIV